MKVQILIDNINSFYVPYAYKLKEKLKENVDSVSIIHNHSEVVEGDILCLIGCEKIFKYLNLNKSNIVVHESWLPKGKGWSPLSWQVIEGESEIPVHFLKRVMILMLEKFIYKSVLNYLDMN